MNNKISTVFEAWFVKGLTLRQKEVMLNFNNGHYTYMQTHQAFMAGYHSTKNSM